MALNLIRHWRADVALSEQLSRFERQVSATINSLFLLAKPRFEVVRRPTVAKPYQCVVMESAGSVVLPGLDDIGAEIVVVRTASSGSVVITLPDGTYTLDGSALKNSAHYIWTGQAYSLIGVA